jgi:site-specific DNA recombinase
MSQKKDTPSPETALGIVRVSSTKQADGNSPDVQRSGIVGYALAKKFTLVDTVEIHESGKDSSARPQFRRALARLHSEGIRHVVFWVFDRVGRNFTDYELIETCVKRGDFELHLASEGRSFSKTTPASEWLVADVNVATSKHYSRELSRRATESMKRKALDGVCPTRPGLGYVNRRPENADGQTRDRGGTVELTDWGRTLVRRMYELRVGGCSLNVIADRVVSEALVPAHKRQGFIGTGRAARVDAILKNPFYVGRFRWAGEWYVGSHERVFSDSEWDQLQSTFSRAPAPKRLSAEAAPPLAGLLRCGDCGCRITQEIKRKDGRIYSYVRCANGKKKHAKLTYVSESTIMDQLARVADIVRVDDVIAERIAVALNKSHSAVVADRRTKAAHYKKQLSDLEAREDRLYDDLSRGYLDDTAYRRQLQRLRDDRSRCTEQREVANADLDKTYLADAQKILELAKRAKTLWFRSPPRNAESSSIRYFRTPLCVAKLLNFNSESPSGSLRNYREGILSAPGKIRTSDFRFRRPTLYPAELRALERRLDTSTEWMSHG